MSRTTVAVLYIKPPIQNIPRWCKCNFVKHYWHSNSTYILVCLDSWVFTQCKFLVMFINLVSCQINPWRRVRSHALYGKQNEVTVCICKTWRQMQNQELLLWASYIELGRLSIWCLGLLVNIFQAFISLNYFPSFIKLFLLHLFFCKTKQETMK